MIPTNTNLTIQVRSKPPADSPATAVFYCAGAPVADVLGGLPQAEEQAIARLLGSGAASGKRGHIAMDLVEAGGKKYRRVLAVGLGKAEEADAESLRRAAGALARNLRKQEIQRATVAIPTLAALAPAEAAAAIVTGMLLASFDFAEYRGAGSAQADRADAARKPIDVTLIAPPAADAGAIKQAIAAAQAVAGAQNFARTIASRPGNVINPPALARVAADLAKQTGLECRVLDEKEMARLGMGGILAVGAGSGDTPPRMIILRYAPSARGGKKSSRRPAPLLVVGKAITFDTGGISIKPAEKMGKMVFDKCGGMAVLGLMYALSLLKPDIEVIGILAAAENHISQSAYRPGDILKMYNGVTVEVTNTDAEGRLVLGDALAWGIETYKPRACVNLATLTGGVVVALGKTMAGVMSNDDAIVQELTAAGEQAGEKMWRLPLGDDQRKYIESDYADIVNSAGREGHPLQGGAFLSFFVPQDSSVPWAHLDIAGVADTEKELPYYAKGATGWGVRTLVNWVQAKQAGAQSHAAPRAAGG